MVTNIAIKEKILSLAKMGKSRESIVEELNVGIGLVDKLICNTPGTNRLKKVTQTPAKNKAQYKKIKQVCRENPESITVKMENTELVSLIETIGNLYFTIKYNAGLVDVNMAMDPMVALPFDKNGHAFIHKLKNGT